MLTASTFENGSVSTMEAESLPSEVESRENDDEASPRNHLLLFPPFGRIVAPPPAMPPPLYDPAAAAAAGAARAAAPPVRIVDTSLVLSDWGMVSEDGTVVEDDGDSSARRMAGSFEHVLVQEDNSSGRSRGVLILDGLSSSHNRHGSGNSNDGSAGDETLTVPGSDSLPSDPGTIHDEDGTVTLDGRVAFDLDGADADPDGDGENWELDNEFRQQNLRGEYNRQRQRHHRRHRSRSLGRNHRLQRFVNLALGRKSHRPRRYHLLRLAVLASMVLSAVLLPPAGLVFMYLRQRERKWQETLMQIQSENQRLLSQEEHLRLEMELLQEEAAIAAARAALAQEQQEEQRRLFLEQQMKQKEEEEKQRQNGPWFHEDCRDQGMSTILDNCWVKAKADIQLGDCAGETKDFFKEVWDGWWKAPTIGMMEYWEQMSGMFEGDDDGTAAAGEGASDSASSHEDEDLHQDYKSNYDQGYDDVYPLYDPFAELMDALLSVGQSVASSFSTLMRDEATRAVDIEQTIHQGLSHAKETVAEVMATTKSDMKELSREALSTLSKAMKGSVRYAEASDPGHNTDGTTNQNGASSSNPPQRVTLKGLFDTASAVASLNKAWNEAVEAVSTDAATFESNQHDGESFMGYDSGMDI